MVIRRRQLPERTESRLRASICGPVAITAGLLAAALLGGCGARETEKAGRVPQIDHQPIEKKVGTGGTEVRAYVLSPDAPEDQEVTLHYRQEGKGGFSELDMDLDPGWEAYTATIPEYPKGTRIEYYIKLGSQGGEWLASFPPRVEGKESWISFRCKGDVWPPLMALHVGVMFAGLIAIVAALLYGVAALWNTQALQRCAYATALAALLTFFGGIPIGILVTLQRLGPPGWEGIPIGADITDSKTLFIVLWWIVAVVIGKGSIFRRNPDKNWARPSRFAWFVIIGAFFSIAMYLVPHSI